MSARQRHEMLDVLVAQFLLENPSKRPSTTSILDLLEWSHQRCERTVSPAVISAELQAELLGTPPKGKPS